MSPTPGKISIVSFQEEEHRHQRLDGKDAQHTLRERSTDSRTSENGHVRIDTAKSQEPPIGDVSDDHDDGHPTTNSEGQEGDNPIR